MSKGDPNQPTDLSPAGASDYKQRLQAAQKGHVPLGGAPMPHIPRLDQTPPGAGDRSLGVQQQGAQQAATQAQQRATGLAGMAQAMTPEQHAKAQAAGQIIPGVGSAYMVNQPKGVQIGQPVPTGPEMSRTGADGQDANPIRPEGGLSPDTLAGLEAVAEANEAEVEVEDKKVDTDKDFDGFDFEELGSTSRDMLNNKERRDAIEVKITDELDFEGLIIHQELRQRVPILKGFEPMYRTPGGAEDLFVKRLIGKVEGSERYVLDYYTVMGLVCGLYALNDKPLPSHLDKDGEPIEELFDAKMKHILKFPLVIIADLACNFSWFTVRVQKLLGLDKVKDF